MLYFFDSATLLTRKAYIFFSLVFLVELKARKVAFWDVLTFIYNWPLQTDHRQAEKLFHFRTEGWLFSHITVLVFVVASWLPWRCPNNWRRSSWEPWGSPISHNGKNNKNLSDFEILAKIAPQRQPIFFSLGCGRYIGLVFVVASWLPWRCPNNWHSSSSEPWG